MNSKLIGIYLLIPNFLTSSIHTSKENFGPFEEITYILAKYYIYTMKTSHDLAIKDLDHFVIPYWQHS